MRTIIILKADTKLFFKGHLRFLAPHLTEEQLDMIEVISVSFEGSQVSVIGDTLVVKSCCPQYHDDNQLDLPY